MQKAQDWQIYPLDDVSWWHSNGNQIFLPKPYLTLFMIEQHATYVSERILQEHSHDYLVLYSCSATLQAEHLRHPENICQSVIEFKQLQKAISVAVTLAQSNVYIRQQKGSDLSQKGSRKFVRDLDKKKTTIKTNKQKKTPEKIQITKNQYLPIEQVYIPKQRFLEIVT